MAVSKKRNKKKNKLSKSQKNNIHRKVMAVSQGKLNSKSINLINEVKEEIITLSLKFMDDEYTKLELEAKEYFNDILKVKVERLKEILKKTGNPIKDVINKYINDWAMDINKLNESFILSIVGYLGTLYEERIEELFYIMNDNNMSNINENKQYLKNLAEELYKILGEYYEIYLVEFSDYIVELFLGNQGEINEVLYSLKIDNYNNIVYDNLLKNYEDTDSKDYKYVDNYRELNKIAFNNGFIHIRDNGGHGIFTNKSENRTLVIPQGRKIGRGLSILIQKQIHGENVKTNSGIRSEELQVENQEVKRMKEIRLRVDKLKGKDNVKELLDIVDENSNLVQNSESINRILYLREIEFIKEINSFIIMDNFKEAIRRGEKFLEKYPESARINGMVGCFYADSGDYDNAIKYHKKHVDLNGNDVDVYMWLIKLLNQKGRFDEANKYEIIFKCKFGKKLNIINRIEESIINGDIENAEILFESFSKEFIGQISADDYVDLARTFLAFEYFDMARKACNKALQYFSEKQEAIQLLDMINLLQSV